MAKLLNKDQFTYQKERDCFLKELQRFHASRGTPFTRIPCIGGKQVDLYLLYYKVTGLGGKDKVNNEIGWEEIQEYFHIPRACTNSGLALKHIYLRYLSIYEKVHHFGEEPNQRQDDDMDTGGQLSARKKSAALSANVPMSYNFQQHKLPELVRKNLDLPQPLDADREYQKLEMALESGLPNEVDFVLNVCTLLSNEGKHILKVPRCPRVINLLMAHVGIFTPAVSPPNSQRGTGSLKQLHEEGWRPHTKSRNFLRFWYDSVEDREIKKLISPDSLAIAEKRLLNTDCILAKVEEEEDALVNVLHLGHDQGLKQVEGQRVIQVASILRNLSFEEENMEALANNLLVFRFLLLCIHSRYSNLRQLGLDTLGNLALKMVLDPVEYSTTKLVIQTLHNSIISSDKFEVVSGMDLLARLCQVAQNEELLSEHIEERLYQTIISMLTVHDIQLIVHTLEALYQLSELGPLTSTYIANVTAAVDTLVSLVTVEAQSYGPGSLIGIKVVEQVPAGLVQQQHIQQQQQIQQQPHTPVKAATQGTPQRPQMPPPATQTPQMVATPPPPQAAAHRLPVAATPPPPSQPAPRPPAPAAASVSSVSGPAGGAVHAEGEAMASNWIQAHYEWSTEAVVTRMELYSHYFSTCTRQGSQSLANANTFANSVRLAFPRVEHQRIDKSDGTVDIQYKGLQRRSVPLPFPALTTPVSDGRVVQKPLMRPPISTTVVSSLPAQGSSTGQRSSDQWRGAQRHIVPAQTNARGMLHTAIQQRLASPPMSPTIQERPSGPISPTSYPTIQQALLNQPGPGVPQQPGSPGPNSPTSNKPPDSNLIKSLLANKVTQNMHRLHQQQQQGLSSAPATVGQGQLHPALTTTPNTTTVQHQPPEKRAKKRKASSSPTPVEPKVAATDNCTQVKPDPLCSSSCVNTANTGPEVLVPQGTSSTAPTASLQINITSTSVSSSSSPTPLVSTGVSNMPAAVSSALSQVSSSSIPFMTTAAPLSNSQAPVTCTVTAVASSTTSFTREKVTAASAETVDHSTMKQQEAKHVDQQKEMLAGKIEMNPLMKEETSLESSGTTYKTSCTSASHCPGNTNCGVTKTSETGSVSIAGSCPGEQVNSLGHVSEIPGHMNGLEDAVSRSGPMETNHHPAVRGVNGGKAQEPLVNGLCSPAPSDEPDLVGKDLIPQTVLDIQEMKKEISIAGKKQISALLSENSKVIKQQLFGLNGVVKNHLGNGDCHVALLKDNNGKAPGDKQETSKANQQVALTVENGYPSPASSSSDQPCRPNGGPDTPHIDYSLPQADTDTARGVTSSLKANSIGPGNAQQDAQSEGASLSQHPESGPSSDLRASGQCVTMPPSAVQPHTATPLPLLPATVTGTQVHASTHNRHQGWQTGTEQPPATHTPAALPAQPTAAAPTQDILAVAMKQTLDIPAASTLIPRSQQAFPAPEQPTATQSVLVSQLQSKPLASQPVVTPEVVSQLVQPANQPQLALGQLQMAVDQPLQAAPQPQLVVGQPQQAMGQPQQAMGQPQQAMGQPQQASGQPQQAMGQPQPAMGQPQPAIGQPQPAMGQQQQAMGQPQQAMGQPQQANGQPQQAMGQPQQAIGQPQSAIGQPQPAIGQPQQAVNYSEQAVGQLQQAVGHQQQAVSHSQQMVGQPQPRVVFVQQNGQQVPMVVQQQGIQGQLLQAGVINSGGQVIHTSQSQVIQAAQVMTQGQLLQGPPGQIVQPSQAQIGQASQAQMAQTSQSQVAQTSQTQITPSGQVMVSSIPQTSIPNKVQIIGQPAVVSQGLVSQGLLSQGLVSQGLVVMSVTPGQSQAGWATAPLNPQTFTQQVVAAQKLPQPSPALASQALTSQALASQTLASQALASQALTHIAPRPQMVVVSQTTGPNNILQQQLQLPTTASWIPPKSGNPVASQAGSHLAGPMSPADTKRQAPATPTPTKSAKKKKVPIKKGQRKVGNESNPPATPSQPQAVAAAQLPPQQPLKYWCDWKGCNRCFETWSAVSLHALAEHFHKTIPFVICQWEGCDGLRRAKWSFLTHLQDRHLTETALRASAIKRLQQPTAPPAQVAPAPPPQPSAPPVYPNDAAYQAIRRFSARPPYPEFAEMKEGPVTKHIRLTSALILRNLARYSAQGRSKIKRHEEHLSYVALSNVESSNALANCLWELHAAQ